jgi:hypothetical protein
MRVCAAILVVLYACAPVGALACTGINSKTKQRQSVHEIYRSSSHPKRCFAQATHDPKTGRPLIIYYRRYATAPSYLKRFVRSHEYCHHAGYHNVSTASSTISSELLAA